MKTFTQFITESEELKSDLAAYRDKVHAEHGVELDAYHGNGKIHVSRIVVPKNKRGTGVGSQVMRGLNDLADKHKVRQTLSPATDFGGSSVSRLTKFYKSHGYVENKGRNKDYTTREAMYRDPKP